MVLGLKDIVIGLGIVLGGLWLSMRYETTTGVILTAIVTTLVLFIVIGRRLKSLTREIFVTGILVGFPETYVFLIQPNVPSLPPIPGMVELFFGAAIFTRLVILILQLTDNPARPFIQKVTKLG